MKLLSVIHFTVTLVHSGFIEEKNRIYPYLTPLFMISQRHLEFLWNQSWSYFLLSNVLISRILSKVIKARKVESCAICHVLCPYVFLR